MEKTRNSLGRIPAFMLYFFLGQAGFVRREPASTAAWIVGVLVVGAVLLGAPDRAMADQCPGDVWWPECIEAHCSLWCVNNTPPEWQCAGSCYMGAYCRCVGPWK